MVSFVLALNKVNVVEMTFGVDGGLGGGSPPNGVSQFWDLGWMVHINYCLSLMYNLGARLYSAFEGAATIDLRANEDDAQAAIDQFSSTDMFELSNSMRAALKLLPKEHETLRSLLEFHSSRMQDMRDTWVRHEVLLSAKSYRMEKVVASVIFSGFLKDARLARSALALALRMICPERRLFSYLLDLLNRDHGVMSAATMYH